jgi:methionyl-tRNA formyltransferase
LTGKQPRVALIGGEAAGLQALRLLLLRGCEIVAVVASESGPGRGATLAAAARRSGLPLRPPEAVDDLALVDELVERETDLLLNVHSLVILPEPLLTASRIGSFNLHPGPLPEYAGLMAPSWAIYNGEETHAVTLHWMEPAVDTGPVAWSSRFAVEERDTGLTLSARCAREGVPLIDRLLGAVEARDEVPRVVQDPSRRRYYSREPPQRGMLVWSKPARRIVDFVRASDYRPFSSPWGHPKSQIGGKTVEIVEAAVMDREAGAPPGTIATVDGTTAVASADLWVAILRISAGGAYVGPEQVLRPGETLS